MSLYKVKSFLGILVLLAYLSIGVFGLFRFIHTSEMLMVDCPYAQNSHSICDNSLDHVNNWQQFSNVSFSSLSIFLFLIFGLVLYFFNKHNFLKQRQYFYRWKYYLGNKKFDTYSHRIIKWLSLFENSPSLLYVRHN